MATILSPVKTLLASKTTLLLTMKPIICSSSSSSSSIRRRTISSVVVSNVNNRSSVLPPSPVASKSQKSPNMKAVVTRRKFSAATRDGVRDFFCWLEERFGGGLSTSLSLPRQATTESIISDHDNTADDPRYVVADRLDANDLQRLMQNEIAVLQINNFYPRSSAEQLGKELSSHALEQQEQTLMKNWKVSTSRGLESSDVFTLGAHLPYNIAVGQHHQWQKDKTTNGGGNASKDPQSEDKILSSSPLKEYYYDKIPTEFRERRRRGGRDGGHDNDKAEIAKLIWPLDQLRLELDEIWPYGSSLSRRRDKFDNDDGEDASTTANTMGGGLPRIMIGPSRWSKGFVHVDEMAPLSQDSGLFSANIYLQLPPPSSLSTEETETDDNGRSSSQPVLEIWPLQITNRWDWYRNAQTLSYLSSQDVEGQVFLRKALGEPIRVSVNPGDLVLISTQRPHCAIGFQTRGAVRVSLQTFIQFSGLQKPLEVES